MPLFGKTKGTNSGDSSCKHPNSTWGDWQYSEGVTSGIQWRIKVCDNPQCKATVESEAKSV